MAEKKPSNREQVKQIIAQIEDGIQELFQSERYAEYLRTMSRFHNYSYNNTILIHMQMPNATQVAGFNKWKNQFGRHVKKGEKGLTIIAPTPFKKKIEEMKLDPDTSAPVLDGNGNVVMEEREIEIPLFRPVKVFDVSQTEGRPLPSLAADLTGNVQHYEAFMEALRRVSPVPMTIKPIAGTMDGFFSLTSQTITIKEGMSQVQTVGVAVHEITHAMLHNREQARLSAAAGDETKEAPKPKDRNTEEVEAESVSYTVCQYFGIETSANSMGYIASWSRDKSLPELKASLETISKTASALISDIDRHFAEVCKERGIDLTVPQEEQMAVEAPAAEAPAQEISPAPELSDTPERFMGDMMDLMDRLYQAGLINRNFPPDNREQIKAEQVRTLRTNPTLARAVLEKFIREETGSDEARALLDRLDGLIQAEKLAALGKEYVYKMEANPTTVGPPDSHLIQAYEKTPQGALKPDEVLFVSSADQCRRLLDGLNNGTIHRTDFFKVRAACVSHYATKDGAELDALEDVEGKIYLGRRDHYDNRGHYMNYDDTLLHISDREKLFNLISGGGFSESQDDMLDGGYFSQEDYAEFDALRVGVLKQFDQTVELLFDGKPFQFIQPELPDIPQADQREALYLLDDSVYLHVQASEGEWDYTLYTRHDMTQLDGGRLEAHSIEDVVEYIRKTEDIGTLAVDLVSLDVLEELRDAADQSMQAAVEKIQDRQREAMDKLREHFAQEDAALWDTTLDEYPVPNDALTLDDLIDGSDLLPLSMEQAAAFLEQDMTIYMVETGKEPAMLFDADELSEQPQGAMFAVPREEWEESQEFRQAVAERMRHQEEREQAFLDHGADCFAIYQVKLGDVKALHDIRYESLDWLKSIGRTVERENYDLVYTAPLPSLDSTDAALERLWDQFNNEHPADFQHPSMSVNDIIALKRDGVVSCHYCDSVGFTEVPDFLPHKPTVAELEAQVKVGQQISLMDLADATHREERQKKSVVAQLKNQPRQKTNKTAPKKSAEKEI